MKDFYTLLTASSWLMEDGALQVLANAYPDTKAVSFYSDEEESDLNKMVIKGNTAIIPIMGPLFAQDNFITKVLGVGKTYTSITKELRDAAANSDVENIVLSVNTPGGQTVGVNATAGVIKEVAKNKPVKAFVHGNGASAGYWLISAADEIYMDATAGVGSIGVKAIVPKPVDDDWEMEIVNSDSPNKAPDVSTKEGQEVIRTMLDDLAEVFIAAVAEGRNVSEKTVLNDFGKGGILIGQKAVDAGMADGLATFEEVLELINNNTSNANGGCMDLNTLKSEHKDVFDAVVAEVTASMSEKVTTLEADIAAKAEEIATLKSDTGNKGAVIDTLKASNEALEERTKALERETAIRAQKEMQVLASATIDAELAKSDIPKQLHSKVAVQIDFNKFVSEDKGLDTEAFVTAIKAEIKEWEGSLGAATTTVAGVGNFARTTSVESSEISVEAGSALSRMSKLLGVEKDEN